MDPRIAALEKAHLKSDRPSFKVGDTLRVDVRIREEDKTRIQPFEGVVIAKRGGSIHERFILRRVSYGEGVERSFLLHSPFIEKMEVVKAGRVRRAKLYYLRKKIGKGTRIPARGGSAASGGTEERFGEAPPSPAAPPVRSEAPAGA